MLTKPSIFRQLQRFTTPSFSLGSGTKLQNSLHLLFSILLETANSVLYVRSYAKVHEQDQEVLKFKQL
jgi:hypothetical protein